MHFIQALLLLLAPALPPAATAVGQARSTAEIPWYGGPFDGALRRAGLRDGLVLVYFWMDESEFCKQLYQETLQSPETVAALAGFTCVSAKATDARGAELVARFGVKTLPTLLFLRPDGQAEDALLGYISAASFRQHLDRIRAGTDTVGDLQQRAEAAPDDLVLRYKLAQTLIHVGRIREGDELVASIRAEDPDGRTVIGAQLALYDMQAAIRSAAPDTSDPTTYELAPAYDHVRRIRPREVAFEGWNWIAALENAGGRRERARAAWMEAFPFVSELEITDWADEVVWALWDARQNLTKREQRFALDVAQRAVARALTLLEPGTATAPPPDEELVRYVARMHDALACAWYMNKKRDKAIATLQRSLELDPGVAEHLALLDHFER